LQLSDNETFFFMLLLSIILLFILNNFVDNIELRLLINLVFISESVFLMFFFSKAPFYFSLILCLASFYYFINLVYNNDIFFISNKSVLSSFPSSLVSYFRLIGSCLILLILIYEYFADAKFSTNSLLILTISLSLIFYNNFSKQYSGERDFTILFLVLVASIMIFPNIMYKIVSDSVGQPTVDGWVNDETVVYIFLGRPLAFLLTILGYTVLASGKSFFYEDIEAGFFREIGIAESCSGIDSIIIFVAALTSYIWVRNRSFNKDFFYLIVAGITISYFANLIRMCIIILVGHYMGIESLRWVHKYIGWVIFTIWTLLFWSFFIGTDINKVSKNQ